MELSLEIGTPGRHPLGHSRIEAVLTRQGELPRGQPLKIRQGVVDIRQARVVVDWQVMFPTFLKP